MTEQKETIRYGWTKSRRGSYVSPNRKWFVRKGLWVWNLYKVLWLTPGSNDPDAAPAVQKGRFKTLKEAIRAAV